MMPVVNDWLFSDNWFKIQRQLFTILQCQSDIWMIIILLFIGLNFVYQYCRGSLWNRFRMLCPQTTSKIQNAKIIPWQTWFWWVSSIPFDFSFLYQFYISEPLNPLFWFISYTQNQKAEWTILSSRYWNLVIDSMGYVFHHKRAPKPNLLPNIKDFNSFFKICVQLQVFEIHIY